VRRDESWIRAQKESCKAQRQIAALFSVVTEIRILAKQLLDLRAALSASVKPARCKIQ